MNIIVQPNLVISYSYINVSNYKNADDVYLKSKPLNAFQLELGVKLIANSDKGFQPYAMVSYVRNIHNKTQFKADTFELSAMELGPFMRYTLGLRKSFHDNAVVYLQGQATDVGREGFGVSAGF